MKKMKFIVLLTVIASISSIQLTAQIADFNGTWKIDRTKSTLPEYTPVLTKIDIKISGDSLLTQRFYDTGNGQEYPFTENLTLDGKEYNIVIYEMPRKTKASWSEQDGFLTIESAITISGDSGTSEFISKESWKIDKTNNTFTISFKNKMSGNDSEGAFILTQASPNQ
jgi:hypothetical protein